MRMKILSAAVVVAAVLGPAAGTVLAAEGYVTRPARGIPASAGSWPNCKVYAHRDGPYKGESVSTNRNGGPPSYSPNVKDCPDNGYFVQGPPPAR